MNSLQKVQVEKMRASGIGFKEISEKINIPVSTIKSYCYKHSNKDMTAENDVPLCPQCGQPVPNARIYDYALKVQLREIMIKAIRKDIVSCCVALAEKTVNDKARQEEALRYLTSFTERNAEDLIDGSDDFLMAVERIIECPDSMEVKLLSGRIRKHRLRTYSPKRG